MSGQKQQGLIRERCDVVSPQEGVGSARGIWGVEAREGEHVAVTCRFLGDVEVDGGAGCLTVRCVRQHAHKELRRHGKNCGGEARRQPNCRAGRGSLLGEQLADELAGLGLGQLVQLLVVFRQHLGLDQRLDLPRRCLAAGACQFADCDERLRQRAADGGSGVQVQPEALLRGRGREQGSECGVPSTLVCLSL